MVKQWQKFVLNLMWGKVRLTGEKISFPLKSFVQKWSLIKNFLVVVQGKKRFVKSLMKHCGYGLFRTFEQEHRLVVHFWKTTRWLSIIKLRRKDNLLLAMVGLADGRSEFILKCLWRKNVRWYFRCNRFQDLFGEIVEMDE